MIQVSACGKCNVLVTMQFSYLEIHAATMTMLD